MTNNYLKFITLLLLWVSILSVNAQDNTLALIAADTRINESLDIVKHDHIKDMMENDLNKNVFTLYDWDINEKKIQINKNYIDQERVASHVAYMKNSLGLIGSPEIKLNVDSTGKTTSAYITHGVVARSIYKVIIPYTSEVINYGEFEFFKDTYRIELADFKKEFGGDPAKIRNKNSDKYRNIAKKVIRKHKKKIDAGILESVAKFPKRKAGFKKFLKQAVPYCYPIEDQPDFSGKKMKEMDVLAGSKQGLAKGEVREVAVMKNMDGHPYLDIKTSAEIKEVTEDRAHIKNILFGRKSLAKDIKKGMKAYFINNSPGFLSKVVTEGKVDRIRVAVDKDCVFCDIDQEKMLMESPAIILVERSAPELSYFDNLIKQERFLDHNLEDLQGKKIGTEVYLKQDGKVYNAIDVSSNQVVSSIKIDKKFLGLSIGNFLNHKDVYSLVVGLNPDQLTMSIASIIDEKKGKIKSVLAKNLVGFSQYDKFEFYVEIEEDVDGETIKRAEIIGEGRLKDRIDIYLAKIKVKKGGKEIRKMIDNGHDVKIRYKQKQ